MTTPDDPASPQEKAQQLVEDWGFPDPLECMQEYITDSLCPGICMNEDCYYSTEVEHDCQDGYCEECETQSVKSIMILMGVI